MDVSRVRFLRGPNLWSRHASIEAVIGCSGNELSIDLIPGFESRIRARFPELGQFQPKGHLDPMSLAHVLEAATLGLQIQAGCPDSGNSGQRDLSGGD